ncbi:MAG TPA: hypothetical protein VI776_10980 [Anaerolineales bacterium]|nr:hypothetical protein [Anaerolineales bacterium]
MIENIAGFAWFVLLLAALTILQRRLHFETQAILLLITRQANLTYILFSLLFFPGVLLHETSHYLVARLLGVRTGRFSLLPQPLPDGRLQLGYVETASTDLLRDALIGSAPLISGGIFVAFAGLWLLELPLLWQSLLVEQTEHFWLTLRAIVNQPDFWLWFYLIFTVSSMMFPSVSDRRTWFPILVFILILVGLALMFGAGPWLVDTLAPWMNRVFISMAVVLGISAVVHFILLPPLWILRSLLTHWLRLRVA